MAYQSIVLSIDKNHTAFLTLNRPEKHNAFNEKVIEELSDAFESLAQNKQVRALVLKANGKSFSAGADLDWMRRMADYDFTQNVYDAGKLANMLHRLNTLPIPTIAQVEGAAYGGGVGLVACCDIVVATEATKFCLSEVKLGLIPATISPYVIAAIGERVARKLFITAEVFGAHAAIKYGLVSQLATKETINGDIETLLAALSNNSPAAMAAAKELVFSVSNRPVDQTLRDFTSEAIARARDSKQGREGVNAFLNRRKPDWCLE